MKAVLVINMPNSCEECDYCGYAIVGEGEDEYKYRSCCLSQRYLGEIAEDSKDSLCPLKPLPIRPDIIPIKQQEAYVFGWNDCIREICDE